MLSSLRSAAALGLFGLSLAAPTAHAQDPPTAWIHFAVVDVEPSMVEDFIAVQRELTAYEKKSKTKWRLVSRTAVFGDTYRFLVMTPAPNLASFDDTRPTSPELASLVNRVQRYVTQRKVYAVRVLPEFSNPLPEDEAPSLMVVNVAIIAPGREQEYVDIMNADFFPHFKDAETHHDTGSIAIGGEGGFLHLYHVDDFAQLDEGSPAMRGMSAEGARAATAKLSGIVIRSELWLARVIAEVSYTALPEESEETGR